MHFGKSQNFLGAGAAYFFGEKTRQKIGQLFTASREKEPNGKKACK